MDIKKLADQYQAEVPQNILPFWEKYAFDSLYGGVYEAVAENGEVISMDKPVIAQAQAIWAFAWAYQTIEPRPEWLELAGATAEFLLNNGRDKKGTWYHTLDRRGSLISESTDSTVSLYVVLALGQLFKATGEAYFVEVAQKTLVQTLKRRDASLKKLLNDPNKQRYLKPLAEPALIGQVLLEAEGYMDRKWYKNALSNLIRELTDDFYEKRTDVLLDRVTPEGHFWDCPEGRIIVPGHVFETAGILMELADRARNRKLLNQMLDLVELTIQAAWDEVYGGIYNKMDLKSLPSVYPDWHYKRAGVHLEALQTLLKAHLLSARKGYLENFEKVHEYVWAHFPDATNGEWYDELDRTGQPILRHKITPQKGCLSTIRNLYGIGQLLGLAADAKPARRRVYSESK
ncbi:AGE family epimerase/isomerase [Telluribacter sp. SYSU D00476]|uniref:AGE family epimerase/isomerase n=1 Tax=Telluribacter sp. SYSU D00476 TaxID=2811430 RepID=UPI001FF5FF87|nr:AGE family epimerase/isomerase [Telluribacter sp. SYSU D00476]